MSSMFLCSFKSVSKVLQGSFKKILQVFQRSFLLHVTHRSYPSRGRACYVSIENLEFGHVQISNTDSGLKFHFNI